MNWSETEAFCPPPDYQGYVRINLQGRETQGIVTPGQEYERLWNQISDGLKTFVDADSGRPIIQSIRAPDQIFPPGERLYLLPDLIVQWSGITAKSIRAVRSPTFGNVDWPTPGLVPDGQPGHHVSDGWLMASGPSIRAGSTIEKAHLIDMAPTIYSLLNKKTPVHLAGTPINIPGLDKA